MSSDGLRVAVLGPVAVEAGGSRIDLAGANARALVAALALSPRTARSVDALADDVWGDELPKNPRAALQTLVSRVRAAAGADAVRSTPGGYALGDASTDLAEAVSLLDDAAHAPDALGPLDAACALWRGEPGADLEPAPVAAAVRDAAAALRARLDAARAQGLRAAGRLDEAVDALEALADAHPYDEVAHAQLMRALADAGRTAEALTVFADLRARLRDDLGADPGEEVARLNASLLRGQTTATTTRLRIGLQAAPNELLGRDDDLAAIDRLLTQSRVVTILGTGGLGKTRLAQAVAAASVSPAVVVVPLAGVRDDGDVIPAIAGALGISEASGGGTLADLRLGPDLRARVLAPFAEQPTLLVLDNCEQVIDGVAAWTADALAAAPALRVLATSRTPLAIAGEVVYPLAPLGLERADAPAVRLFLERARAVRPAASLSLDVITRLCGHLDGLPLAIELAAARVRTMTPEQIEQRLQDRFALLTTGDRTAPERHRTLEAVIGWSWDLLDDDARHALAVLAVLPAGFSADTAAAVLRRSADDVIERLVSQSLLIAVERPGGLRFRMLETIREYALARLADDPDGVEKAWDAAAEWARIFSTAQLGHAFELDSHTQVRAEHDNLIAVLRRAIDHGDDVTTVALFALLAQAWMVQGALTEMISFTEPSVTAAVHLSEDRVRVDALLVVLIVGTLLGQFAPGPLALRSLARVRSLRRRHRDIEPVIGALADAVVTIFAAWTTHETERVEIALEGMRTSVDPAARLVGESLIAQLAENDGRPEVALQAARRVEELAAETGAEWFAAMAAASVAALASQTGQPALALEWLDRADEGYGRFSAGEQQRQLAWLRASNLVALGEIAAARAIYAELAGTSEHVEDGPEIAAIGVYGLAEIARIDGDSAAEVAGFERAMAMMDAALERVSPWHLMARAGALSAVVFDGLMSPAERARWATRLRSRTLATVRLRTDGTDRPVLGTVLVGWSAWMMQDAADLDRGLEALALGEALGARQDMHSLSWAEHDSRAAELVGAERLGAAKEAASALGRDEMLARALTVLRAPMANAETGDVR
ncbi:BTAD domain-containing putative transcriptional regulator [Microbacterium sp. KR10-403]|uniref:ATP-binding protein n=1 Tax=Microbacterium sp. KR10-403 TaxID=3158581 RepID=UPI0032E36D3A